jgi:hypothetical protein
MIIQVLKAVQVVILLHKRLLKRLTQAVQHNVCSSEDSKGDKTFAAPVNRMCYREGRVSIVRNLQGEEVTSTQTLFFDGILTIGALDEFVMNARTYPVVAHNIIAGVAKDPGVTVVYL